MTGINIQTPASCANCKFKGDRWCYIMTWLGEQVPKVPDTGKPEWCPLIDLSRMEDDGK